MKKSFRRKLKIIFGTIILLFVLSEAFIILEILGFGSVTGNLISQIVFIIINVSAVFTGYWIISKKLLEPLTEMDSASKELSEGNLDIDVSYQSEDEVGQLADSFRHYISGQHTMINDMSYIIREFKGGNFNVRSNCREAYKGNFSVILDDLAALAITFSATMNDIDNVANQVSVEANGLSEPSKNNLTQLARVLGCELLELYYDENSSNEQDRLVVIGVAVLNQDIGRLKKFFQEMPSDVFECYKVSFVIAWGSKKQERTESKKKIESYVHRSVVSIDFEKDKIYPDQIFLVEQESSGDGFNSFFLQLAERYGKNSAAVLLSDSISNMEGISYIKKAGGLTICCEPEQEISNKAIWNAARSSIFNYVLEPVVMGSRIALFVRKRYLGSHHGILELLHEKYYKRVIKALKKKSELLLEDFKEEYVIMGLLEGMKQQRYPFPSADFYIKFIEESDKEQQFLLRSIMRGMEERIPDVRELLELEDVLSEIPMEFSEIRIWVTDCGNGLEVYVIAMMFADYIEGKIQYDNVKIFATDMMEDVIVSAIKGRYTEDELEDIPEKWKEKYFRKEGDTYFIRQRIRNMVIFSVHDIITNPPFARLDLVVCRNAMNFFRINSRKTILKRFSYALKQNGILMLGKGQDIQEVFHWFARWGEHETIFTKERGVSFLKPVYLEKENLTTEKVIEELMAVSMPSCIIINDRYEIIYTGKSGGQYLAFKTGEFSKNLFDNIDRKIGMHINTIIRKLKKEDDESRDSVKVKKDSGYLTIHVLQKVISESNYYLIWFDENEDKDDAYKEKDEEREELERELKITQESLIRTLEELESVRNKYEISNEKLQSTNEELVVINDELQGANRELAATNRKLTRVNEELLAASKKATENNADEPLEEVASGIEFPD